MAFADQKSEVFNLIAFELALLRTKVQVVLGETLENLVDDLPMRGEVVRPDEDVIKINRDLACSDEVGEDVVHERLECRRTVTESEVHDARLEETLVGDEGSLPFVAFLNPDVVVAPTDVELGEDFRALQLVDDVGCEGQGIAIFHSDVVEFAVVLDEAEFAVLLLDEEDRGGDRRFAGDDVAFGQGVFDEALQLVRLDRGHGVDLGLDRGRGVWCEVDSVIPRLVLG